MIAVKFVKTYNPPADGLSKPKLKEIILEAPTHTAVSTNTAVVSSHLGWQKAGHPASAFSVKTAVRELSRWPHQRNREAEHAPAPLLFRLEH